MTSRVDLLRKSNSRRHTPVYINTKVFNPDVSYELVLKKLKKAFIQLWEQNRPSPSTGLEDYEELGILGEGSYGKVKLVKKRATGKYYAVKIMSKEIIVKTKQVIHVFNEKNVLSSVEFPFLLTLEFSSKDNDNLYLGLPVVNGGELFTYHRKMRTFNEKQARFYAAQVFLALEYLHYMNLLYRDLKPENILIDRLGYIKITDFGFTKRVEIRTSTLCGTPEYLAPEIIQSKPYGTSVDWWSFGILLYEFVNGHSPFASHNRDVMFMYAKICDGEYRMPAIFSSHLKDLVLHLLQVDVTKRYGCLSRGNKDIKDHQWFETVNWYDILNRKVIPPFVPTIKGLDDLSYFGLYKEKTGQSKSEINKHAMIFKDF